MKFEKPEPSKNPSSQEVFKSNCKECGGEFTVFITPTADKDKALEELAKIKEVNLCPNCRQ